MHFLLVYIHIRLCTEMLVESGIQNYYTYIYKGEQVLCIAVVHWLFIDSELYNIILIQKN
jgi:hypothetical protein